MGGKATSQTARVMFVYWGRRGALPQFTFEVARAALADPEIESCISVSRQTENFTDYARFGAALFPVDTFQSGVGAAMQMHRILLLRRQLYERLRADRTQAVIELMPHIWSPFIMPVVSAAGVRYATVVHDADAHPGDRTSWVKMIIDRTIPLADPVLTLSTQVADRLAETGRVENTKLRTLFHPDLTYGNCRQKEPPSSGEPWRLLFLGRIMPYKGLGLFLDTVELLQQEGISVTVGVFGEGPLGENAARLLQMGAEIVNRWLTSEEIAAALDHYHAVVLSHTEASQSGVAASAFGAGVPVVATPVGGLVEQVVDGVTGILAQRANAIHLSAALKRLFEPQMYRATCASLQRRGDGHSMRRFVTDIVSCTVEADTHREDGNRGRSNRAPNRDRLIHSKIND